MAGIKNIIVVLASLFVVAWASFALGTDKTSYDADIAPSPQTYSYTYDGNRISSLTGSLVDFGARMYDPHTGRWTTQDPMAWKYLGLSPYNYCGNDRINRVDIDGESWFYCLENGSFISHIPDEDDNVYMISSDQLKCGRSDSALRSYRDLDMLSNAFGQMAIEGKLSNSTVVGVISDLFSRANKTRYYLSKSNFNKASNYSLCRKWWIF